MTSTGSRGIFAGLAYERAPSPTAARRHALERADPAEEWVEALPLGNGSLGAMSHGGHPGKTARGERLQINHASAWSGSRPPV